MSRHLTDTVLVPVAHEEDLVESVEAIRTWLDDDVREIVVLHVIEKAGGAPDKAPLALREEQAEAILRLARQSLEGVAWDVETELRYATSILDEIQATARDIDATAIVYFPRPGGRLTRLLSGNLTPKLVLNSSIPVIVLPSSSGDRVAAPE